MKFLGIVLEFLSNFSKAIFHAMGVAFDVAVHFIWRVGKGISNGVWALVKIVGRSVRWVFLQVVKLYDEVRIRILIVLFRTAKGIIHIWRAYLLTFIFFIIWYGSKTFGGPIGQAIFWFFVSIILIGAGVSYFKNKKEHTETLPLLEWDHLAEGKIASWLFNASVAVLLIINAWFFRDLLPQTPFIGWVEKYFDDTEDGAGDHVDDNASEMSPPKTSEDTISPPPISSSTADTVEILEHVGKLGSSELYQLYSNPIADLIIGPGVYSEGFDFSNGTYFGENLFSPREFEGHADSVRLVVYYSPNKSSALAFLWQVIENSDGTLTGHRVAYGASIDVVGKRVTNSKLLGDGEFIRTLKFGEQLVAWDSEDHAVFPVRNFGVSPKFQQLRTIGTTTGYSSTFAFPIYLRGGLVGATFNPANVLKVENSSDAVQYVVGYQFRRCSPYYQGNSNIQCYPQSGDPFHNVWVHLKGKYEGQSVDLNILFQ